MCAYCSTAKHRPDYPLFHAKCKGCSVRSIAQSHAYHLAMRAGRLTAEYKRLITLALGPEVEAWHAKVKAEHQRIQESRAIL